jgi:hypothetical protein
MGRTREAAALAREALAIDAEHQDALVLMGQVALRDGDIEAAREHCHAALRVNAADPGAIGLLAAIKARTSWVLGLWWRYATWMQQFGETGTIAILIGGFVAYRLLTLLLSDLDQPAAANAVQIGWLALCIYSWVGPGLFQRAVERELAPVALDEKF